MNDMTPEQQRVLDAAERLTQYGEFTYGCLNPGDVTPMPTCAACGVSSWGEIEHSDGCGVQELIDAVRALGRNPR